jgi:DNA polymerase bacteriophage-type
MKILWLDLETYSETPIRDGTFRYAADAEIMLFAYAFDNGPVKVWDVTEGGSMPADLHAALHDPETVCIAHNAMFDFTVIRYALDIFIPYERRRCTMVQALSHSLPGALGTLCEVMGIDEDDMKDSRGRELVMLFCKPRPKTSKIRRATRETHPKEWQEFIDYAGSDIKAMRAISDKIPKWNYSDSELELWRLDQRINDRGFKIDRTLAAQAIEAIAKAQARLGSAVDEATLGTVQRAGQRDKLLGYILAVHGIDLPNLQKDTLERRLNDETLPREVKHLLAMRLETSKASTSKYKALIKAVNDDDRLRGTLQFCGASRTGRDAGRTFQPQNLFRPTMKQAEIDMGVEALRSGHIDLITDNVMELAANAIRGCIVADEGKKLVVSDLSNIEGRFAAWIAGEEWKLQAFRDFDSGQGHDLYKVAYAAAFDTTPDQVDGGAKSGPQRQIGKVMELMLQYEGGVGAFLTGAATYKIDLDEMARLALPLIPLRVKEEALDFWNWSIKTSRSTFDLPRETFVACDSLKRLWREAHPQISSIWSELKEAMKLAIHNPGTMFPVRRVQIRRDGAWCRIILPSGRALCYPSPRVDGNGQISYAGINPYSRKWSRIKTYGGKLFENIVQAGSRDVFMSALQPAEDAGFEIVMRVHDELITEAPDNDDFSDEQLAQIMATNPPWAMGLPLAAGGFESYRYKKE